MSIEALNWARKTYVGECMGKSLLRAIADYADENGKGFPSLTRLAEDCDMSIDSVRRRMKLLEDIGLAVVVPCWMDEHGKRNHERRGRQTSSDIMLCMTVVRRREDVEPETDACENPEPPLANSKGGLANGEGSQQQGAGSQSARAGVALQPPLNELPSNKDSTPNPLPGGFEESEADKAKRAEHLAGFRMHYPRSGRWDWTKVDPVWSVMTLAECERAHAAAPFYGKEFTRPSSVPKRPEAWLKSRMFENFPDARIATPPPPAPKPVWYPEGCRELQALNVACAMAGWLPIEPRSHAGFAGRGVLRLPIDADLGALSVFATEDVEAFVFDHVEGSQECAAWVTRLAKWTGLPVKPRKVWLEPPAPEHALKFSDPNHRFRKSFVGLRVPWRWPPRKDGTLTPDDNAEGNAA